MLGQVVAVGRHELAHPFAVRDQAFKDGARDRVQVVQVDNRFRKRNWCQVARREEIPAKASVRAAPGRGSLDLSGFHAPSSNARRMNEPQTRTLATFLAPRLCTDLRSKPRNSHRLQLSASKGLHGARFRSCDQTSPLGRSNPRTSAALAIVLAFACWRDQHRPCRRQAQKSCSHRKCLPGRSISSVTARSRLSARWSRHRFHRLDRGRSQVAPHAHSGIEFRQASMGAGFWTAAACTVGPVACSIGMPSFRKRAPEAVSAVREPHRKPPRPGPCSISISGITVGKSPESGLAVIMHA